MIASRVVSIAAARSAFRRSAAQAVARPAPVAARRTFSSTRPAAAESHSSDSHGQSQADESSDLPYAISSVVVFGALFFYLTSPASKAHNEHGQIIGAHKPTNHGHGSAVVDDKTGDDAVWLQDEDAEQSEDAKEDKDHAAHLDGHQSLLNMPTKPFDHQKSPSGRDPSNETSGPENSNFQHGIAASKDGDHISDPKKVVAAANAAKQEKKAAKEQAQEDMGSAAESANSPEGGKEEEADPEGKKEEDKEDSE